jgi:hypothetical protein
MKPIGEDLERGDAAVDLPAEAQQAIRDPLKTEPEALADT